MEQVTQLAQEQLSVPAETASNGFAGQESEVFAGGITGVTTGTEAADPAVVLDETTILAQQDINHSLDQNGIDLVRQ